MNERHESRPSETAQIHAPQRRGIVRESLVDGSVREQARERRGRDQPRLTSLIVQSNTFRRTMTGEVDDGGRCLKEIGNEIAKDRRWFELDLELAPVGT